MAYVMPEAFADAVIEIFEMLTGGAAISYRSYSGRAMYGAQCVGFEVDGGMDLALGVALQRAAQEFDENPAGDFGAVELVEAMAMSTRTDNMGRGMIVYWPSIQAEQDKDEEVRA